MVGRLSKMLASSLSAGTIFSQEFCPRTGKVTERCLTWDVNVEASGLVVAGSGTTAFTLTYLIWAVLQKSVFQEALQREVRDSLERISKTLI
jgi:hypothetical protein